MMWGYDGFGLGGFGMGIGMLLFWGLIIFVVVALVRAFAGTGWGYDRSEREARPRSPLEILRERYARGEIDRNEFEQKRTVLEKSSGNAGRDGGAT